jgi:hypothetical protein
MTGSTSAIQRGFDYQARWFWRWAARLLWENPPVSKVWFESGPKGLDDVGILRTTPQRTPGGLKLLERHQVKFQVRLDKPIEAMDLTDPKAIGAETVSFIERARDAFLRDVAEGQEPLLALVTDRQISPTGVMGQMFLAANGHLDVPRLMDAKRGQWYDVRRDWQAKANLDDPAFRRLIESIMIEPSLGSFRSLDEWIDLGFRYAGMAPIDGSRYVREDDDLIRKLAADGIHEFTADSLRDILAAEGLLLESGREPRPRMAGVRTFTEFAEDITSEVIELADFAFMFDRRRIDADENWSARVLPDLEQWAQRLAQDRHDGEWSIRLECSPSMAVAAGSVLPSQAGIVLHVEQKSFSGRATWDLRVPSEDFQVQSVTTGDPRTEAALIVAISRDTEAEAKRFIADNLPDVGQISVITVDRPGGEALRDGGDAAVVARAVLAALDAHKSAGSRRTHVLPAVPNAVMFLVGRQLRGRGVVTVHDYDLHNDRTGTYEEGVTLPIRRIAPKE